jgi:hypothetical protein
MEDGQDTVAAVTAASSFAEESAVPVGIRLVHALYCAVAVAERNGGRGTEVCHVKHSLGGMTSWKRVCADWPDPASLALVPQSLPCA